MNIQYTFDMYTEDVSKIVQYIESFKYPEYTIIGVHRGSLPIAVHISNITDTKMGIIKFQSYDGNDKSASFLEKVDGTIPTFVLEDILDTGKTFDKIDLLLKESERTAPHHFISIYGKPNDKNVKYYRENDRFVDYWWEKLNF